MRGERIKYCSRLQNDQLVVQIDDDAHQRALLGSIDHSHVLKASYPAAESLLLITM